MRECGNVEGPEASSGCSAQRSEEEEDQRLKIGLRASPKEGETHHHTCGSWYDHSSD